MTIHRSAVLACSILACGFSSAVTAQDGFEDVRVDRAVDFDLSRIVAVYRDPARPAFASSAAPRPRSSPT